MMNFERGKKNKNTESFDENVFLVFFKELSVSMKPSSLWNRWSMIKTTVAPRHNINIDDYHNLKSFIKIKAKGYKPKKARVLTLCQIKKFLDECHDLNYLASKVILIFEVCGALRTIEFCNINVQDVEDTGSLFVVTIKDAKNYYPRNFVIGRENYNIIKKYILLRPNDIETKRFFINYQRRKCTRQVIGKNKISEVPKIITICLNLEEPEKYTGHCFRRSSATLLANSGASLIEIKHGRWKSSSVAEGYIEHLLNNRKKFFEKIITSDLLTTSKFDQPVTSTLDPQSTPKFDLPLTSTSDQPSVSTLASITNENADLLLYKSNENSNILRTNSNNPIKSTERSTKINPNRKPLQQIQNLSSENKILMRITITSTKKRINENEKKNDNIH
ncbi:uncharacterized protein LOC103571465 [Microplitis demolitor]|uniref:uncharacterized protein LOC103571465 n=1 Tax=Microplitis demolitor TaxID=69319 RepID=UPI0004CD2909|nr:uncharacterized protein LOC103571465 [Microplitis demolitor]